MTALPEQLAHLADERRWVCWRYEIVKGRTTKVPYSAKGAKARSNSRKTWAAFHELPLGGFDGPGLMFADGMQGVDLDACLDDGGIIEAWAAEVVGRLDSYTEVSPSGRGLKVFFTGPEAQSSGVVFGEPVAMPDGATKRRELAHSASERYFTVTGEVFHEAAVRAVGQDDIEFLKAKIEAIRDGERARKRPRPAAAKAGPRVDNLSAIALELSTSLPPWLRELIEHGAPEGQRSEQFYKVVQALRERGYDADRIEATLSAHPAGIAAKFAERLRVEIERVVDKGGAQNLGILSPIGDISESDDGELLPPEFSDDHLAMAFVKQFGCGLRWSPGMDWLRDTGTHWTRDDHLVRYNAARMVCRQAAAQAESRLQTRLASAKSVSAVVSLAQSDPKIVVPADQWDRNPHMLNTPAGVVDLRAGRMRTRVAADYFTQCTAVSPDSKAGCPTWLRFIGELFADAEVIEFVQRMLGYTLTGDRREQKLFFFHGTGSNGKSTLLDLVMWTMGSYALKLPTVALMQSPIERHPTELAQLRGKRLAMSNELEEGMFWAESRIKELTGDATLTARYMRQDFFEFTQTQKHLIAGNHKPRLRGGDPAIARRMVLIPFTEKFEDMRLDNTLPAKLQAEAPAILAWLIAGAVKWYADGLAIPKKVQAASRDYLADHDDVSLWIDECCERAIGREERSSDLYQSFAIWKRARGEHAPSQTTWGQRIALVPGLTKRVSNGIRYAGIGLTAEALQAVHNRRAA